MMFPRPRRRSPFPSAEKTRRRAKKLLYVPLAFVALSLCACQPAPTPTAPASPLRASQPTQSAAQQTASPDQILNTDPSEIRLGDICEALMMYYSINKSMPPHLDDVQSATTEQLSFISPSSGKPYGYSPNGLVAGNGAKRIYVYDPAPEANGKRWCIEGIPPSGNGALWMETVQMPEATFELYTPGQ